MVVLIICLAQTWIPIYRAIKDITTLDPRKYKRGSSFRRVLIFFTSTASTTPTHNLQASSIISTNMGRAMIPLAILGFLGSISATPLDSRVANIGKRSGKLEPSWRQRPRKLRGGIIIQVSD